MGPKPQVQLVALYSPLFHRNETVRDGTRRATVQRFSRSKRARARAAREYGHVGRAGRRRGDQSQRIARYLVPRKEATPPGSTFFGNRPADLRTRDRYNSLFFRDADSIE